MITSSGEQNDKEVLETSFVRLMQIIGVREGGAGGAAAPPPPIFWEFIYSGKNYLVIRATTFWWLDEYIDPQW